MGFRFFDLRWIEILIKLIDDFVHGLVDPAIEFEGGGGCIFGSGGKVLEFGDTTIGPGENLERFHLVAVDGEGRGLEAAVLEEGVFLAGCVDPVDEEDGGSVEPILRENGENAVA